MPRAPQSQPGDEKMVDVDLSDEAVEQIKADLVAWTARQSRSGQNGLGTKSRQRSEMNVQTLTQECERQRLKVAHAMELLADSQRQLLSERLKLKVCQIHAQGSSKPKAGKGVSNAAKLRRARELVDEAAAELEL